MRPEGKLSMNIKAKIIVVVALFIFATILVCLIPRFTGVDVTLQAVKITNQGEALDTYEIVLRGNRLDYLFGNTALDLSIAPFDELSGFTSHGEVKSLTESEIFYAFFSAVNAATDDVAFLKLGFSPDMDRWILVNDTDQVYYVASVSGVYTTEELAEYFSRLIPRS